MSEPVPTSFEMDEPEREAAPLSDRSQTTDVEKEDTESVEQRKPFNPAEIRMDVKTVNLDVLLKRMANQEIDLAPPFQRQAGVWDDTAQSRLIESLLIRIPIPAFYFDARDDDKWVVVDGLQRLTILKRFLQAEQPKDELVLTNLEFLTEYNGKRAADLPRFMRRRIEETLVVLYLMQPGTPEEVKFNLFKRVNTGGEPLTAQEIRHALNQGPAALLLEELAESPEFLRATAKSIPKDRMADRECVLRVLAFLHTKPAEYQSGSFDAFLHQCMKELNGGSRLRLGLLKQQFLTAMTRAHLLLGKFAFRKFQQAGPRGPINKALLEAWSVNLATLTDTQVSLLSARKQDLYNRFVRELNESDFNLAVTQGTGAPARVKLRFERIARIIQETLES